MFCVAGGVRADRVERVGRSPFTPQADRPHDHAETDPAREVHPPGEPAGSLLLRSQRGESKLSYSFTILTRAEDWRVIGYSLHLPSNLILVKFKMLHKENTSKIPFVWSF